MKQVILQNILIFIVCCISSMTMAQNTIATTLNTEDSYQGYTLFSPVTNANDHDTYLTNNCGEIINEWTSDFPAFGSEFILEDGSLMRAALNDQSTIVLAGKTGRIEHFDWDNNPIWSIDMTATDFTFHHDFYPLPNGNVLMIVAYRMTAAEAIAAGRDPNKLADDELYDERIVEIEPDGNSGGNIVWQWRAWDHLIQDFDNTKANFGVIKDNVGKLDVNYLGNTTAGRGDWLHLNAMDYNEDLDQIIISSRFLDEFYIIDHSTTIAEAASDSGGNSGKGGEILFRWGNPEAYDIGDASDRKSYGQHTVHWIPETYPDGGKIMFFNNGIMRGFSSVDIIDPPVDNMGNYVFVPDTSYGPEDVEWSYTDPDNPSDFFASFVSGAYRMPNGNTLINNGPIATTFEVSPSSEKVWEYISPVPIGSPTLSQGDSPVGVGARFFRTKRFEFDYVGFTGRDLTPNGYVENNPMPENCQSLSIPDLASLNVQVYPNPSTNNITILSNTIIETIEVYDLSGKSIKTIINSDTIDVSNLANGIYLLKITSGTKSLVKRIVKI